MNSKFLLIGSVSTITAVAIFLATIPMDDITPLSVSDNYEELCGYPVTDATRLEIISQSSWASESSPLKGDIGNFTHVQRSLYLTEIPLLQYWFELDDGKEIYFELGACDLDDSDITLAEIGLFYYDLQPTDYDKTKYHVLEAPGNPMIYKDSLKPVLEIENCQRVAKYYTEQERERLFTRDTVDFDPLWENQVFPLMDYCTSIGNYELKTLDGNINWSFTLT